jgi:hypothetical protein
MGAAPLYGSRHSRRPSPIQWLAARATKFLHWYHQLEQKLIYIIGLITLIYFTVNMVPLFTRAEYPIRLLLEFADTVAAFALLCGIIRFVGLMLLDRRVPKWGRQARGSWVRFMGLTLLLDRRVSKL